MQINPRDDGRFEVADRIFESQEAAQLYLDSRTGKQTPVSSIEKPDWSKVLTLLLAAPVAFYAVSCVMGAKDTAAIHVQPELPAVSTQRALAACETAFNMADGDIKMIPHAPDQGTGGEYLFSWDSMPYGNWRATASCTVDRKSGRVTSFMINGRSLR